MKVLKQLHECDNDDFLADTICYKEIEYPGALGNRTAARKAAQERQKLRDEALRKEKKESFAALPFKCKNNDFLAHTISHLDKVKGVGITLIENRERIKKAGQEKQKERNEIRREKIRLKARGIYWISGDEWIAQNYFEKPLMENEV